MPRTPPHFVQITALGWARFDALQAWNGTAARLWTRLARSIDGQGVVITTAVALAADIGVSVATARRHLTHMEGVRAFVRFRLPGGLTAFAMNPNEVWSGKTTARARAPYTTGVLGGDSLGQAALRRGSWFLPGMEPISARPVKSAAKPKAPKGPETGDLFAAAEAIAAQTPDAAAAPDAEPSAPSPADTPSPPDFGTTPHSTPTPAHKHPTSRRKRSTLDMHTSLAPDPTQAPAGVCVARLSDAVLVPG